MEELRREQIGVLANHFKGQAVTQDAINEFCAKNKIEPTVMQGELLDFIAQVEHDEIISKLFPDILKELQNLKYTPEFATASERRAINKTNDEVRVNIAKLIEAHDLPYQFVSPTLEQLGGLAGQTITSAGTTIFNKIIDIMNRITEKELGGKVSAGKVAKYAEEMYMSKVKVDKVAE
jgi:hypothetical protein